MHYAEHDPLPWVSAIDLVHPSEREVLWRSGQLFWTLHGDQADCYRQYRAWEAAPRNRVGLYRRIFVFDCSRRYGKDWLCLVIKLEDAIRRPGSIHTYGTAFAKDIGEIVIPLMDEILGLASCPSDIEPTYHSARRGQTRGYYFPNGSVIKLVGIDKNPDGLRGRGSDGAVITEAAYVDRLEKAAVSVLYPQFQGRDHARLILQSTAPDTPHHPYDKKFIPDAKRRGAYVFRTIEDNPMLDDEEREEFIDAAGGREDPTARREYFGERVRETKTMLVPEFSVAKHVVDHIPSPEWADTYTVGDPGMRDLFGLLWSFWDPARAKLCIQAAWAKRNAGTPEVAAILRGTEVMLWGGSVPEKWGDREEEWWQQAWGERELVTGNLTRWWDEKKIRDAPYARYSDTDLRLLGDLGEEHGIEVTAADKSDSKESSLYNLRQWFYNDLIEIDRVLAAALIEQLQEGQWNQHRTDYLRTEEYGHFDLIDALRYLVRHVDRERQPRPPEHILNPKLQRAIIHDPASRSAQALNRTIARRNKWQR